MKKLMIAMMMFFVVSVGANHALAQTEQQLWEDVNEDLATIQTGILGLHNSAPAWIDAPPTPFHQFLFDSAIFDNYQDLDFIINFTNRASVGLGGIYKQRTSLLIPEVQNPSSIVTVTCFPNDRPKGYNAHIRPAWARGTHHFIAQTVVIPMSDGNKHGYRAEIFYDFTVPPAERDLVAVTLDATCNKVTP